MDQVGYNLNHKFSEAMDDDLNTSQALAFPVRVLAGSPPIVDQKGLSPRQATGEEALAAVNSVFWRSWTGSGPRRTKRLEALIQKREAARRQRIGNG